MESTRHRSDHEPLLLLQGEGARAALTKLLYDVDDELGWLEVLDRALAEGGTVVIERSGDWIIFPP